MYSYQLTFPHQMGTTFEKSSWARKEKMQKSYEITFLVKPDKTNEDVLSVLAQNNVTIDSTNDAGERELAYTIAKHDRAHYWSVLFTCDPTVLVKIEKALRVKKDLLRFLIISRLREAEKPAPKPKTETPKAAEVKKEEPKTETKIEPEIKPLVEKTEPKIAKKTVEAKKVAEPSVKKEVAPEKKPVKPRKKKEFSSEELNKKLEELVKED